MRNLDEQTITQAVLARNADTEDPRLHQIMTSLVQHLHAFARDVKLTEDEWLKGIEFLTATGKICSTARQEFILLSDTLGLSTLIVAQNHRKPQGCTEATVFGPFHVSDAPRYELGADISNGMQGIPWWVSGTIRGLDGEPVPYAEIEVWQADDLGFYDVQYEQLTEYQGRAVLRADAQGAYRFKTIVPKAYPIPSDGPVGTLIKALNRHPWRPAHLHFMISADGYERLVTHVFQENGEYLDSDAVFGVRSSLIAEWNYHVSGTTPDGLSCTEPYYTLDFDFVLNAIAPD
ncbi:hydroxyquinol 1,2-dioxygenase [Pseudomonas agarici]|uniref:Hydroxyquinol 1,2-dioxygenase n=1 Tax=Pseudomonas agarici TaxID=46677 RepID=A0A0X1T7H3_PSEAA|nr:intradiol ring-cleavage dioxygenase [Pseudomonas agarici]AMB88058.1 hydroxyquinol 1,2-dioxygenase [Pseudomonas agarici]NWB92942.1 intradiol ring-cleavage dioxygenase [Pseudomonas agarici]NWC09209.1 intradiol ring-cleavage dioxygenase [Pseudomonas agarici]SEK31636.1 hydroxyquinol 1,2-dioxygenase [Pseudomonas agarici]